MYVRYSSRRAYDKFVIIGGGICRLSGELDRRLGPGFKLFFSNCPLLCCFLIEIEASIPQSHFSPLHYTWSRQKDHQPTVARNTPV